MSKQTKAPKRYIHCRANEVLSDEYKHRDNPARALCGAIGRLAPIGAFAEVDCPNCLEAMRVLKIGGATQ